MAALIPKSRARRRISYLEGVYPTPSARSGSQLLLGVRLWGSDFKFDQRYKEVNTRDVTRMASDKWHRGPRFDLSYPGKRRSIDRIRWVQIADSRRI